MNFSFLPKLSFQHHLYKIYTAFYSLNEHILMMSMWAETFKSIRDLNESFLLAATRKN